MLATSPDAAREKADRIVRNTYRTLMTRGMKGCYVWCTDAETNAYFKERLEVIAEIPLDRRGPSSISPAAVPRPIDDVAPLAGAKAVTLPFTRLDTNPGNEPNVVPLLDLKLAAGPFSQHQCLDEGAVAWARLPEHYRVTSEMFVAQVVGRSMNRRIPNGAWCLFRFRPAGTRNGKVVVARHRAIEDPETGGGYTVKIYESEKRFDEQGGWRHARIVLRPDSDDPAFVAIEIPERLADEFEIVAELLSVLE